MTNNSPEELKLNTEKLVVKCLRTLSGLSAPKLVNQSSCRILTTHAKTRPVLHDGWSIRSGENRPDSVRKHMVAKLEQSQSNLPDIKTMSYQIRYLPHLHLFHSWRMVVTN